MRRWIRKRHQQESVDADPNHVGVDVYDLLASLIAGKPARVRAGEAGVPAHTDGDAIVIDPTLPAEQRVAAVVVQAALMAAGSLDPSVLRRIVGRRKLARRYLAIEGRRALGEIADLVPGVVQLSATRHEFVDSGSPVESLELARRGRVPDLPDIFGEIRFRQLLAIRDKDKSTNEAESGQHDLKVLEDLQEQDGTTEQESKEAKDQTAGAIKVSAIRNFARVDGNSVRSMAPPAVQERETSEKGSIELVYPEWDRRKNQYRPNWCTISERWPTRRELEDFDYPRRAKVQRGLARLGVDLQNCRRQFDGDGLDIDAVVASLADMRTGYSSDEAVYVGSRRRARNLSVLILLDGSASAGERLPSGDTVNDVQRRAAAELANALEVLGDRVAIYGFRSLGRSVESVPIKTFDNRFNGPAIRRLGGLKPAAYTRIGAAIRHGAHLLTTHSGTPRRLLIVMSDGFSYDIGYEGAYGEDDAARALQEARVSGVGCLCLTIGSPGSEALDRVFGPAAYARVDRFEELFNELGPLFRNAIDSADSSRKVNTKSSAMSEV